MQWLTPWSLRSNLGQYQGKHREKHESTGYRPGGKPAWSAHRQLPGPPAPSWEDRSPSRSAPAGESATSAVSATNEFGECPPGTTHDPGCAHFRAGIRFGRIPFAFWACARIRVQTEVACHLAKVYSKAGKDTGK